MTILYVGLGVVNLRSTKQCLVVVNAFREQSERDDPNNNIMGPQLELKQKNLL